MAPSGSIVSARPEMVIFPNLFVGRKKLRTFIFLRKKIIIISGQTLTRSSGPVSRYLPRLHQPLAIRPAQKTA
jgi:hypothetical protein